MSRELGGGPSRDPKATRPPLLVVDLAQRAGAFPPGSPSQLIAQFNESGARLSVFQGEADWHEHPDTDELFVVLSGELTLDTPEGQSVALGPLQAVLVPGGQVHRPRAVSPTVLLCCKRLEGATNYYEVDFGDPVILPPETGSTDGHQKGAIMDWKSRFEDVVADLERERDELRVRAHLAKAEAKDELARLEQKLDELRFRAGAAGTEAKSAMGEIGEAAGRLADEIKDGFARVRKTL